MKNTGTCIRRLVNTSFFQKTCAHKCCEIQSIVFFIRTSWFQHRPTIVPNSSSSNFTRRIIIECFLGYSAYSLIAKVRGMFLAHLRYLFDARTHLQYLFDTRI